MFPKFPKSIKDVNQYFFLCPNLFSLLQHAPAHSISNTFVHLEHDYHVFPSIVRVDGSSSPIHVIVSPSSDLSSLIFTVVSNSSPSPCINIYPIQTRSNIVLSRQRVHPSPLLTHYKLTYVKKALNDPHSKIAIQ